MTRPLSVVEDERVDPGSQAAALAGSQAAARAAGVLGRAIHDVRAAFALLTRVPVGRDPVRGAGVRAHAVVGGILGSAALLPVALLGGDMPVVAAILAVAVLAIVSGGLHLDGLADTFDALVAVGPDAAERARRDPAIGAAGATALIVVIALDVALLAGPLMEAGPLLAGLACVIAASVSRSAPAVLALVARPATGAGGLAAWFARGVGRTDVAVTLASAAFISLALGSLAGRAELAAGGAAGLAAGVLAGAALIRLRRQFDGDLLGATVEIAFASSLLATATLVALLAPAS